jgi:hypothetical protein
MSSQLYIARPSEKTVVEIADSLSSMLVMEEVLHLISRESFAFPVRVLSQPLLLACLNVLRDGSHGPLGISIRQGMNHLQMFLAHSCQGFGIVSCMPRGESADQISHFIKYF